VTATESDALSMRSWLIISDGLHAVSLTEAGQPSGIPSRTSFAEWTC